MQEACSPSSRSFLTSFRAPRSPRVPARALVMVMTTSPAAARYPFSTSPRPWTARRHGWFSGVRLGEGGGRAGSDG